MSRAARKPLTAVPDLPAHIYVPPSPPPKDAVAPKEMRMEYLECHAEGHWWKHSGDTEILYVGKRIVGFVRNNSCQRCGKTRSVTRDLHMDRVGAYKYSHVPGFTLKREGTDKREYHGHTALRAIIQRETGVDYG